MFCPFFSVSILLVQTSRTHPRLQHATVTAQWSRSNRHAHTRVQVTTEIVHLAIWCHLRGQSVSLYVKVYSGTCLFYYQPATVLVLQHNVAKYSTVHAEDPCSTSTIKTAMVEAILYKQDTFVQVQATCGPCYTAYSLLHPHYSHYLGEFFLTRPSSGGCFHDIEHSHANTCSTSVHTLLLRFLFSLGVISLLEDICYLLVLVHEIICEFISFVNKCLLDKLNSCYWLWDFCWHSLDCISLWLDVLHICTCVWVCVYVFVWNHCYFNNGIPWPNVFIVKFQ